jgi:hypothetical protein
MKLIFLSSLPISRLFGEKLDAWWFASNGFEVEFWDIAGLFYSEERLTLYFGGAQDYRYIGPEHRIFDDLESFQQSLQALSQDSVVWYLSRFHKITPDDWIFAELQQKGIRYYLQHFDTLINPSQFAQKARNWLGAYRQRFSNRLLRPQGIVGSGRLGRKQSLEVFPDSRFISIPSIKVRWQPSAPMFEEAYNLFVDESVDYAPDAKMLGCAVSHNPSAYYVRLNRLFDEIESWSGIPVVIAASGKYHYTKDRFEGRRLIYGQTLPLIQNAKLVIGHMSLALDQCLVSKKPVLIVDDPDFTELKRRGFAISLMHFVAKPILMTTMTRAVYSQALVPQIEAMEQLVWDYLKEKGVSQDFHPILKEELAENGQGAFSNTLSMK